jgi:hypothetical protein
MALVAFEADPADAVEGASATLRAVDELSDDAISSRFTWTVG